MSKVYGYKTADSQDFWTTYTRRGFVRADSLEEALELFGLKVSNGFTVVAELTDKELAEEILRSDHEMLETVRHLQAEIDRIEKVAADLRNL